MIVYKERADRRFNSVSIKRICLGLVYQTRGSPPKKKKEQTEIRKLTLWAKPKECETQIPQTKDDLIKGGLIKDS